MLYYNVIEEVTKHDVKQFHHLFLIKILNHVLILCWEIEIENEGKKILYLPLGHTSYTSKV